MSQAFARAGVLIQLVVLFVGTQMPGPWRDGAVQRIGAPVDLSALAHFSLFAGMALLLPWARWWRLRPWHTPMLGLALALLTEGLQFVAVDRHPNLAGIVQDMTGTLLGWTAATAWWQMRLRAPSRSGG